MEETAKEGKEPKKTTKVTLNYEDDMLLVECEGFARDGYDDYQIAEILGVETGTFSRNKRKKRKDGSPSLLSLALLRGRRPLDVFVENSLYKRCMGLKVTKTKTIKKLEFNPLTMENETVIYEETEITELPPDVNAANLWLRNRKPDFWNAQTTKLDHTTNGKDMPAAVPMIAKIEHVTISSDQVATKEADT